MRKREPIYVGVDREPKPRKRREARKPPRQFFPSPSQILKSYLSRYVSFLLLGVMVALFFLLLGVRVGLGSGSFGIVIHHLALSRALVLSRPWTIITSIFTHSGFFHLFINGIILFFLGPELERRVGRRSFLLLFLGAGSVAGLAQISVISPGIIVLGASGAIFGILATLTVLSPRMPILLFFFIPMQLWMVTLGFGLYEGVSALYASGGPIAHLAHFTGLLVGIGYGFKLRRERRRYRYPIRQLMGGRW